MPTNLRCTHLPLGPVTFATADRKLASFGKDIDDWRAIATVAAFDEAGDAR